MLGRDGVKGQVSMVKDPGKSQALQGLYSSRRFPDLLTIDHNFEIEPGTKWSIQTGRSEYAKDNFPDCSVEAGKEGGTIFTFTLPTLVRDGLIGPERNIRSAFGADAGLGNAKRWAKARGPLRKRRREQPGPIQYSF
jgi:hypothetical protein